MQHVPRWFILTTLMVLLHAASGVVSACPFCPTTQPTLGERVARSDVVALAAWAESVSAKEDVPGQTTFDVLQLAKAQPGVAAGRPVTVPQSVEGRPGDLFLLTGKAGKVIAWDEPLPTTELCYQYVVQAPSPEAPAAKRLAYYLKFLEFSDAAIADDAYFEFAKAPYEDVAAVGDLLPRDKLQAWVGDRDTPPHRLGLYGLMLGLCGDETDAALLERRILEPGREFRLGIDGVIGGYLLLTGEQGLGVLERAKLQNAEAPDSEVYAVLQALRFVWTYGDGRISQERLKAAVRHLLDRPTTAEFALRDLARWKDWAVVDRVATLYDSPALHPESLQRTVRRCVVGYLAACAKDDSSPAHVVARGHLAKLRERDPQLVGEAERLSGVR